MTDAAVIADSGPAPIDGAPINEAPANFNSPLGSQIPPDAVAKPAEPAKPASLDDSIDRAIAKSNAKQAEAKAPEPKADVKEAPKEPSARGEGGKFASKDHPDGGTVLRSGSEVLTGKAAEDAKAAIAAANAKDQIKPSHTAEDAPARFTDTAKAKWHAADPEIRGEVLRMDREYKQGYEKHRANSEAFEPYRELDDRAKQGGRQGAEVFREYVNMEDKLRENPIAGLDMVCQRLGFSLRDVASHVLNQTPDQNASQQDATIRELRQELASIKEQVGGVTQTIQQQREQSTLTEINKFASENPRFEELADDIAFFMKSGRAKDLSQAYQLAERLNPAPASQANEPIAASNAATPPPVQPDKGLKSINGAPSTGSNPAAKKRAVKSLDEAMDAAFSRMA